MSKELIDRIDRAIQSQQPPTAELAALLGDIRNQLSSQLDFVGSKLDGAAHELATKHGASAVYVMAVFTMIEDGKKMHWSACGEVHCAPFPGLRKQLPKIISENSRNLLSDKTSAKVVTKSTMN